MALGIQIPENKQTSDPSTRTTLGSGARKLRTSSGTSSSNSNSFVLCDTARPLDRLVCCIHGPQKTGKDHFALTAPDPIFHQGIDPAGLEGVGEKFYSKKRVYRNPNDYYVDISSEDAGDPNKLAAAAAQVWDQFVIDFYYALQVTDPNNNNGHPGTIVWSAENDAWELLRLARFGELTPKTGRDRGSVWGPVNAEYRRLLREPFSRGVNFIMLDKVKDEYANDKRTGGKVRSGMGDVPFMAQVVARTQRVGASFSLLVEDCRQNPSMNGETVPMPEDGGFDLLKMLVLGG